MRILGDYSCMGYEIAGLGVKLARPDREDVVLVGDGIPDDELRIEPGRVGLKLRS
jgi:hypothetical protein